MKLLIFGATGGTGKLVVENALHNGHQVTAFIRDPAKLGLSNPGLRLVQGDVLDAPAVEGVMPGHDAVICCLGAPAGKVNHLRSEGTKNIIAAMKKTGVTRFICQTSLGLGDSLAILKNTGFIFRKIIVPFLLRSTFAEHAIQENFIQPSGLNWTIIRPGSMTNKTLTQNYKHGFDYTDRSIKVKIARADVAHFMLQQLTDNRYQKKVAGISY